MSVNLDLVARLERNPQSEYVKGVTILIKLLSNIVQNPQEEKFRRFKKTNQRIASELLSVDGMEAVIVDAGFELDGDEFVVRGGLGVVSKLKYYRDLLQKRLETLQRNPSALTRRDATTTSAGAIKKVTLPVKAPVATVKIVADKPYFERIRFTPELSTSNNFLRQIEQLSDSVMQYEDESLKKSALQIMPTESFKENAINKLRRLQKLIKSKEINEPEPPLDDLILEELAEWFKTKFFTWINAMPCRVCKNEKTNAVGTRMENNVKVERYLCNLNNCSTVTEFHRYNDIKKLLVTRSGRCGEFANCFTFLCRCLGYDARYVFSTSDHVWSEVFNHSKKRWIHIDPSENVFDSPLMYEHGWKRNLDYVIAFSRDDINDVTWRYSNQHKQLPMRRNLCTENEMIDALLELRWKRQLNVSPLRKKFLTLRTLAELAELLIVRQPTENELKGRSSGSLSWRLERGEASVSSNYVFTLAAQEKAAKEFNLKFSCAKNRYERIVHGNVIETTEDWKKLVYQSENIFRKVENDHKMAYLSRTEDSATGMIQFRFDFGASSIQSIDVTLETKVFENGSIAVEYLDDADKPMTKPQLIGASKFSIRLKLSGGRGDCAWQHAQVFRQSLTSDEFPFQVSAKLN